MAIFAILIFVLTIRLYYEPIKTEVRQASTIRTFDQIAIKAADWPEIMTTDVNVLEKPIQVRKAVSSDPWGHLKTEYAVEVIPVEISE